MQEVSLDTLRAMFTTKKRDTGETFVCLKDDAPEWADTFIREAHGTDMLPDDHRYSWVRDAIEMLSWNPDTDRDELADEFADGVDIYTDSLLAWLKSNLNRVAYCDEAMQEEANDADNITTIIMAGQARERREVFHNVLAALDNLPL